MGPLFSIAVMVAVAAMTITAIFLVAIFFLRFGSAVLMSLLTTAAGGLGAAGYLLLSALLFFGKTIESGASVLAYLGGGALVGLACGAFAAWRFWPVAKKRHRK